jgi:hypothetical protein
MNELALSPHFFVLLIQMATVAGIPPPIRLDWSKNGPMATTLAIAERVMREQRAQLLIRRDAFYAYRDEIYDQRCNVLQVKLDDDVDADMARRAKFAVNEQYSSRLAGRCREAVELLGRRLDVVNHWIDLALQYLADYDANPCGDTWTIVRAQLDDLLAMAKQKWDEWKPINIDQLKMRESSSKPVLLFRTANGSVAVTTTPANIAISPHTIPLPQPNVVEIRRPAEWRAEPSAPPDVPANKRCRRCLGRRAIATLCSPCGHDAACVTCSRIKEPMPDAITICPACGNPIDALIRKM